MRDDTRSAGVKTRSSFRLHPSSLPLVDVPRGEAAAHVDVGDGVVADQLEAAPARGAVGSDPVADLGGAVAGAGQALVEEVKQRARVTALEAPDAIAVERLVDPPHGRLADRVAQPAGGEDGHAKISGVARDGPGEHRAPLEAAPDGGERRLEN